MTKREAFIATMERTLLRKAGAFRADMRLADIPELDSVGRLSLMVMADGEYGFLLEADALEKCRTVEDLYQLICGGR